MSTAASRIKRNLPYYGFPVRRFINGVVMSLAFIIISSVALIAALGYKVNWAAGSIQQTGLLEVNTRYDIAASVYLNGELQEDGMPFKKSWLFPGLYTVRIEAEGYRIWERTVPVKANERSVFRSIILVYVDPKPVDVPVLRQEDLQPSPGEIADITVRAGNELWIDDEFVTRTSADIISPRWFPGRRQIVYQVGSRIVLSEIDGSMTQDLITLTTDAPSPFILRDGGRTLIYQEGPTTKAVELFERDRLIDRLGADR